MGSPHFCWLSGLGSARSPVSARFLLYLRGTPRALEARDSSLDL